MRLFNNSDEFMTDITEFMNSNSPNLVFESINNELRWDIHSKYKHISLSLDFLYSEELECHLVTLDIQDEFGDYIGSIYNSTMGYVKTIHKRMNSGWPLDEFSDLIKLIASFEAIVTEDFTMINLIRLDSITDWIKYLCEATQLKLQPDESFGDYNSDLTEKIILVSEKSNLPITLGSVDLKPNISIKSSILHHQEGRELYSNLKQSCDKLELIERLNSSNDLDFLTNYLNSHMDDK